MSFNNNDQPNLKTILVTLTAFFVFMTGYNYFFENNTTNNTETPKQTKQSDDTEEDDSSPPDEEPTSAQLTVSEALSKNCRINFENDEISGSINLKGGILDEVLLKRYKETVDKDSKNVMLLTPKDTHAESYYIISYKDKTNDEIISDETVWTTVDSGRRKRTISLKTQTQHGMVIERTVSYNDGYLINIKDKIINISDKELKVSASSDLVCSNPALNNYAVVHDGLIGHNDDKIEEIKYSDIQNKTTLNKSGWFGYTDIYWLRAVINKHKNTTMSYSKVGDHSYRCSTHLKKDRKIKPGSITELSYSVFVGPKDVKLLREYSDRLDLYKFDMAIDFGWFFMITKPLLQLLGFLGHLFSSMWVVILVLTLLFKVLTYPLMKKSFSSAAKMRELQPKIASLQKVYGGDKLRMNQEMMLLYKKENVSPMSGCLPMLLQAPIFFCLYKVFFISIDMRHAPLFGWIHDLSAPDPVYISNLFGMIDWDPPSLLKIGIWPLIMGLTMLLQQKLSSGSNKRTGTEKTSEMKIQENMMLIMPVLFTYICASFPVGVVIYWTISNIFSIIQQYYVNNSVKKK
ncbi:MAG: membrane protein insertase YidC [Holosporales bacterium]|jgi:YidC/Oxa1 family membrane protein insertase|nr:membrane protein insertase YidC [Holosporales bacterium]